MHQIRITKFENATINPLTGNSRSAEYFQCLAVRRQLPIARQMSQFLDLYNSTNIFVLAGQTGSGKTTQVPQYAMINALNILRAKKQMVVFTQPRRLAAQSVSDRVATELDVESGSEVGYSFRHDSTTRLCSSTPQMVRYLGKPYETGICANTHASSWMKFMSGPQRPILCLLQ